ncbi:hypothetical protein ALI22I_13665 [Saccharothrix sp. ALI-22-I]|nr:hypothetical protein ALI22I_13665 [Saccharothrix sp. ALI-22-I]
MQLMVCEYQHSVDDNRKIGQCSYSTPGGMAQHVRSIVYAKYKYRIYEAKTGKLIDEFDTEGVADCPPAVYIPQHAPSGREGSDMGTRPKGDRALPDLWKLRERLKPLVERPLGG